MKNTREQARLPFSLVALAFLPLTAFAQQTTNATKVLPPPPMGHTLVAGRDQKAKLSNGVFVALTRISRLPEPPTPVSWGPDGKPLPPDQRLNQFRSRMPNPFQNTVEYEFEATITGAPTANSIAAHFETPAILRGSPWSSIGGGGSSRNSQLQSVSNRFRLPPRLPTITLDLTMSSQSWNTILATAPGKTAQCKLGNGVLSVSPYVPPSGDSRVGQPYSFAPNTPLVTVTVPAGYEVQVVTLDKGRWSRSLSRPLTETLRPVPAVINSPAGQRTVSGGFGGSFGRFGDPSVSRGPNGTQSQKPAPPTNILIQVRPIDRVEFQNVPLQPRK